MNKSNQYVDSHISSLDKRGTKLKYDTQRGDTNKLMDEEYHQQRDSAPFNKADSVVVGRNGQTLGDIPMLETAETFRQTEEATGEYDTHHMIESVRDFQNDATHHEESTQEPIVTVVDVEKTQNAAKKVRQSTIAKDFTPSQVKHGKATIVRKGKPSKPSNLASSKASNVSSLKHLNPYGYKFFGLKPKNDVVGTFQQAYRSQEWQTVIVLNSIHARQPKPEAAYKNIATNQAFQEPEVVEVATADQIMSGFSRNKKEEAYQKRNMSSINMLRSFKTLEFEDKDDEYGLVEGALGSVCLAQNLNRNSQLGQISYGREPVVPQDFTSFQPKQEIVHNVANKIVQGARMRNYVSNFIKEM